MSKVSFFGLNAFGSPTGVNPTWGAAIGAVAANGSAVAFRALTAMDKWKYSELVGLGVGGVASIGLMIPRKTRGAGWASLFATVGSQGILALERALMSSSAATTAATAATAATTVKGISQQRVAQLGMVSADRVPQLQGASQLSNSNPAAANMAGRVPGLNGLAKHFGATIFG